MTSSPAVPAGPEGGRPRNVLLRAAIVSVALVVLAFPALIVAGGFLPWVQPIGRFGAFLNEGIAAILGAALVASALGGLAVLLGGRRGTGVLLAACLLVTAGATAVTARFAVVVGEHGGAFDLFRTLAAPAPVRSASGRMTFATVDGQSLEADVWRAPEGAPAVGAGGRAALVFVHGGSFIAGQLAMRPAFFAWLADRGIVVVDVEYRLAPPPRWHDAPADVLCALGWLRTVAAAEGIDPDRVILMGESAGGSLALVAGYAAGTDRITPSCPGEPIVPAGIVAVAPAADLAGIWEDRTLFTNDRPFPEDYVGGPPAAYPDRYAAASPFELMRPDLPPTLILAAENDHLVRLGRVTAISDALTAVGADVQLLIVPFADHGFDGQDNSFGRQLEEAVLPAFIAEVAP